MPDMQRQIDELLQAMRKADIVIQSLITENLALIELIEKLEKRISRLEQINNAHKILI